MEGWKRQSFRGLVYCLLCGDHSTEATHLSALLMIFTFSRAALAEIQTQPPNCDKHEIPELSD